MLFIQTWQIRLDNGRRTPTISSSGITKKLGQHEGLLPTTLCSGNGMPVTAVDCEPSAVSAWVQRSTERLVEY